MLSYYCRSLLLSSLLVSTALAYDCQVGCYWNSDKDVSVCGEDKNVYPNECFAICQNVTIVKTGSCDDDNKTVSSRIHKSQNSSSSGNTKSALTTGVLIPISKMQQHDGYKLIRKYEISELQGEVQMPVITEEMMAKSSKKKQGSIAKKIIPLMLDSEGYEYIGTATEAEHLTKHGVKIEALQSVPGYNPNHDANNTTDKHHVRRRELTVFGSDDRTKIINTKAFPYSTVGLVGDIRCTGTVISRSAVLTAAHCVYNRNTQQWSKVTYFAPGRGYNGQDGNDPFGTWPVKTITFPKQFATTGSTYDWGYDYDLAVITLQPNSKGQYIGDVVGYVGLDEVSGFDDPDLDSSTITGYPSDKGSGTMWTTGLCPGGFYNGPFYNPNYITVHQCDTFGGNSGSALLRLNGVGYYARGVYVFSMLDPVKFPWNGANFFKQGNGLFDAVRSWSGR